MKKKVSPLKIVHLVLMAAVAVAIVLSVVGSSSSSAYANGVQELVNTNCAIELLALACGFLYLVTGSGKSSAGYYKAFMILFVLSTGFDLLCLTSTDGGRLLVVLLSIIAFAMTIMLATCKDLGEKKTYTVIAVLLICRIISVILSFRSMTELMGRGVLACIYANLLLAGTAAIMVAEKYIDKANRAANTEV